MNIEKRKYPRYTPKGLLANITLDPPGTGDRIILPGEVIDISYTGIKIRLSKPFEVDINHGQIKIEIVMPQSGVPIRIQGILRHIEDQCDFGLQFAELYKDQKVDDLMLECIKLAESPSLGA